MAQNSIKTMTINLILVIGLVFALLGLFWLQRLGLEAGAAYLWLMVIGFIFLTITVLFKLSGTDFWFEIPVSRSSERGLLMLVFGILSLFILFSVSKISSLNFYSPFIMAPLAFGNLALGAETFAQLTAATSSFWSFFISVITASVIEELVLGFAFVAMGSLLLGYGLRHLLKIDFGKQGNNLWDFIMSMVFSVALFSLLHVFNSTYINVDGSLNLAMFGYAAVFRLVLNVFIYKFGNFGLLFSIGVHAVNNAIILGGSTVLMALGSFPGGVIFDAIIIVLFIFALSSLKKIIQEGGLVAKDFTDFE